jgi:RimK-like ATP-grasp domain
MFGESKYDVLKKIPERYFPRTILMKQPSDDEQVLQQINDQGFQFPVIFKPDIGERGFMVKRINHAQDVSQYLSQMKFDFLVQELVDLPLEFGVFYTRFPNQPNGNVTSVVMKEMLTVTGDGQATLQELILTKDRAKLQWEKLRIKFEHELSDIVPQGKVIELVSIGNHCLGTKFLDGNHLITPRLSATFDSISKQIDGFYFGRFDLRCATLEDLYAGRIKIMELNGCGAEPAHIYQPGYSLRKALLVLLEHWRNIFLIARENVESGSTYTTFKQALVHYRKFKKATQAN